jgi:hypothetical protein
MMNYRLLLGLLGMGAWAAPVHVAVFNYVGLSRQLTTPAVEMARDAFRKAGIETVWTVCDFTRGGPKKCAQPGSGDIEMLIMPRMLVRPPDAEPGDIAGFAMAEGRQRAWAFYEPVTRLALASHRATWVVLGYVMVHEVGHVLGLKHQKKGFMRATLGVLDIDLALTKRLDVAGLR